MRRTLAIVASFFILGAAPALADGAYSLDAKGKCHDDHGKFAKKALCSTHAYKMDSKGKCRDEKGRFADMKLCMR